MKRSSRRRFVRAAVSALVLVLQSPLIAQTADIEMDELQRSVELYASVLQEGLGLNVRAGIFSPLSGSVRGVYLAQQGVVLEVTSPLASSRNTFTEFSLGAALERLSGQLSSLSTGAAGTVARPDLATLRESMAMSMRVDLAQGTARELLDAVAQVDVSAQINAALQQAADSARALHALTQLDDGALNALLEETTVERARVEEMSASLQALRTQISAQTVPVTEQALQDWRAALQAIETGIAPLYTAAVARAQTLQEQAALARSARERQWQQELAGFESSVFALVCDYSGGLRALPQDEHVTIILKGLGDDTPARREDRILVLRHADALRCLQREITIGQLQESARAYSF